MAIPFYEPRQQAASECDQVDGHFPPAPSSQAVPLPTANFQSAADAIQTPPVARSCTTTANVSTATANLSASTATRTPSIVSRTSPTITTGQATNSSITANTSGPPTPVSAVSTTAFTIPSNNHPSSAASFSSNSTNTETNQTTFSTAASSTSAEPLPWKLLAVSMCKALKQYYEQTNSPDVFTTAIIEILPSGSPTQSSAAGN